LTDAAVAPPKPSISHRQRVPKSAEPDHRQPGRQRMPGAQNLLSDE
jgi:hypothetical protein